MNKANVKNPQMQIENDSRSQERSLVLKVVRIEHNQPCEDSHSNSCDNCHPWTSCCDSYS